METVGRTTAIAVISPAPRYWGLWLRFNFVRMRVMRRIRGESRIDRNLDRLSFIHFAHWAVFNRMPPRSGEGRRLPHDYILFQSNFNGGASEYIEAFSVAVKLGMRALWGRAYNVPPPLPVEPFVEHIVANKVPTPYYYSAYPHASTKDVRRALALRPRIHELTARADGLDATGFRAEYDRFMTQSQRRR